MSNQNAELRYLVSQVSLDARNGALVTARTILTEENTDKVIAILVPRVKAKLPFWAQWLPIGRVLDALLPGVVLQVLEEFLS